MNAKMTRERAEEILRGQDGVPEDFAVAAVAEAPDFWICKVEDAGKRKDGVADDTDPGVAKRAYSKSGGRYSFVQIWENESDDGFAYAAHVMCEKDMKLLGGLRMRLVDCI